MSDAFNERARDEEEIKLPSERSLGVTFAVVFAIVGLFPLVHGGTPRWWALAVAAAFVAAAIVAPKLLRPLNRVWLRFGLLLHKVVNPVMLGLMFGLIIVPIGLFIRLTRGALLTPRREPDAKTYWIARTPPGPEPDTIKNQF